jgi:glutamine amidotransferase
MGWNRVEPEKGCALLEPGYAYFANSFRLEQPPGGWSSARTEHAGPFISAFERGAVMACQFHPELSGRWGLDLLRRWLERARRA